MEAWYLDCLTRWTSYYKRAPKISELAAYCDRSNTAVHSALISLLNKGHVIQNTDRRFEPRGAS
jgi:DNA-binding IclR family transcriptional regulator